MVTGYRIEDLRPPLKLGFGASPHWDADKQELLFVDHSGNVFRYVPETNEFYNVTLDGRVSLVVPIKDSPNEYLVGVGTTFKIMTWDGISTQPTKLTSLVTVTEYPEIRIEGKCDPSGSIIAGVIDDDGFYEGNFYRFDSNGKLSVIESLVEYYNGLAWTNDNRTMYYVETPTLQVHSFEYDILTGNFDYKDIIYNVWDDGIKGSPEGMAIDADGNLWVCLFGGDGVIQIDPNKETLMRKIDLSDYAPCVTSATFGGKNLDILYVTTAHFDRIREPGSLLAIHGLGVRGVEGGIPFVKNF